MTIIKHTFIVFAFTFLIFPIKTDFENLSEIKNSNNPHLLEHLFKKYENSAIVKKHFAFVVFNAKEDNTEKEIILQKYTAPKVFEYYLTNSVEVDKFSGGIQLILQEVHDQVFYTLKEYISLNRVCEQVDPELNQNAHPDKTHMPSMFDGTEEIAGEGSYAIVKRVYLNKDHKSVFSAVKRIKKNGFKLIELYTYMKVGKTPSGLKFYGCQFTDEFVYFAQENMEYDLDSNDFTVDYEVKLEENQGNYPIMFLHRLLVVLEEFHSIGIIHNDIKPTNIMINKNGEYKLIDFGFAEINNSIQGNNIRLTPVYASPRRMTDTIFKQEHDIYALIMTFIATHSKKGEDVFSVDLVNEELQLSEDCYDLSWEQHCADFVLNNILRILEPDFGQFHKSEQSVERMNLTTLLVKIHLGDLVLTIPDLLRKVASLRKTQLI